LQLVQEVEFWCELSTIIKTSLLVLLNSWEIAGSTSRSGRSSRNRDANVAELANTARTLKYLSLRMARECASLKSVDPRDKIFGTLGIIDPDSDNFDLSPWDCKKTIMKTCTDFVKHTILGSRCLEVLRSAGIWLLDFSDCTIGAVLGFEGAFPTKIDIDTATRSTISPAFPKMTNCYI
jgi:hypothetical protein